MKPTFHKFEEENIKTGKKRMRKTKIGFGAETYVAGNANGTFYSPNINLSSRNSLISLGGAIQKRNLKMTGLKIAYSYLVPGITEQISEDESEENKKTVDILELRFLSNAQFTHKGQLSYSTSRVEAITNPESKTNFNEIRFSTIELALCTEIDINLRG